MEIVKMFPFYWDFSVYIMKWMIVHINLILTCYDASDNLVGGIFYKIYQRIKNVSPLFRDSKEVVSSMQLVK